MLGWQNFLLGQVEASAALAGLVFIGVSNNLERILKMSSLPEYALEAVVLLLAVLITSLLLLIPQPLTAAGIEILVMGIADTVILSILIVFTQRKIDPRYYGYLWVQATVNLCATLLLVIAGIAVLVWNVGGFYWIVPGTLLSIIIAIYDAWVLLVEINR